MATVLRFAEPHAGDALEQLLDAVVVVPGGVDLAQGVDLDSPLVLGAIVLLGRPVKLAGGET
jgi:hypothetical protein